MLHQIFMYSNKVILLAKITIFPTPATTFTTTGLTNWPINDRGNSKLNSRQIFHHHNIHLYSTSIQIRTLAFWSYLARVRASALYQESAWVARLEVIAPTLPPTARPSLLPPNPIMSATPKIWIIQKLNHLIPSFFF